MKKRVALYLRVSSLDQHPETQLYDLQQLAAQRGYEIVKEYTAGSAVPKRDAQHWISFWPMLGGGNSMWLRSGRLIAWRVL